MTSCIVLIIIYSFYRGHSNALLDIIINITFTKTCKTKICGEDGRLGIVLQSVVRDDKVTLKLRSTSYLFNCN